MLCGTNFANTPALQNETLNSIDSQKSAYFEPMIRHSLKTLFRPITVVMLLCLISVNPAAAAHQQTDISSDGTQRNTGISDLLSEPLHSAHRYRTKRQSAPHALPASGSRSTMSDHCMKYEMTNDCSLVCVATCALSGAIVFPMYSTPTFNSKVAFRIADTNSALIGRRSLPPVFPD